jgi:LPXTG-motif cell wall-anchored protein
MTRRNQLGSLCGVGGALLSTLLMGTAVQAQSPSASPGAGSGSSYPGGSSSSSGYPGGGSSSGSGYPGASGGASTAGTVDSSTTTTTTTTIDAPVGDVGFETASEPLPNTGGAPLALTMLGSLMAGGAFMLRRKIN